jgi:hypothetical protein
VALNTPLRKALADGVFSQLWEEEAARLLPNDKDIFEFTRTIACGKNQVAVNTAGIDHERNPRRYLGTKDSTAYWNAGKQRRRLNISKMIKNFLVILLDT